MTEKARFRFRREQRLRGRELFAAVYDEGHFLADSVLVVHAKLTEGEATRLGLSVSKRVGSAPQRNYWKRLIREAFRVHYQQLPQNMNLIVRPRKGAIPSAPAVARSLLSLAQRLSKKS